MKTLPKEQLLKYIEHAIKLESAICTQDQIIENYNSIAYQNKPSLKKLPYPAHPGVTPEMDSVSSASSYALMIPGIITGVIAVPILFFGGFGTVMGIIVLIIAIVMFMLGLAPRLKLKAAVKEHKKQIDNYQQRISEIEKENKSRWVQYNSEMKIWNNSDSKAKARFDIEKGKVIQTLQTYYKQDIIYPKYRNLTALTSIYEYLESGRCDELTGPQGAYNLYEDELRKDIIITQLGTIISNLEQIKHNQYMLYQEIKHIQTNSQRIANELSQIKGFAYEMTQIATLNAYYNGINAASSSALAFSRSL